MQVIRDFLKTFQITDTTFAIGVSGGADSLALALMFKQEFPQYRIIALTVDHKLRPTSGDEAEYVAQVMQKHNIEHHILVWEGEKPQTGIEEQARLARYKLLCGWCKENNIANLVIAHHLFDQAETFLMRLQRGSGLYGLSAISEVSERNGVRILRPLLNTHPDEMKNFLNAQNIKWVEDESNLCADFLRVKLRQYLPCLEREAGITAKRLCEAAADLRKIKGFIEDTVDEIINSKVHKWGDCGFSFDYAEFLSWHKELRFYILRKLLTTLGGLDYSPEADSLNTLSEQLSATAFSGATLGCCQILKDELKIWIIKENRTNKDICSTEEWERYTKQNPEVRNIKIPYKLRAAMFFEKLSKKI